MAKKDDKGAIKKQLVLTFVEKGVKMIPDLSEQGEEGLMKIIDGALTLADDIDEGGKLDKALDVDG